MGHSDAARLGSGKSVGRAPIQKQAAPTVQKPAQQAQPVAPAPAPQAPAPSLLAAWATFWVVWLPAWALVNSYLIFVCELASSLITGLLIAVLAGFVIMFVMRKLMPKMSSAGQSPNFSTNGMQRASLDQTPRRGPAFTPAANAFGGVSAEPEPYQSTLPPGFNQQTFLENAKQYFVTLQKAWDQGDLASLREFATLKMFATIQQDLAGRADASNQTDVVTINAQLLGVETADGHYFCSVQFGGMIREQ